MVYELRFFYWDDNPDNDEEIIVGVYSSYELADRKLKKLVKQPRFQGKKDAFFISEYKINEENEVWRDGFWEACPEFFMIELTDNYFIEKFEDQHISLMEKDNKKYLFYGEIDNYQDLEQCVILKNHRTGRLCCFDKRNKLIVLDSQNEQQFLKYLKDKYFVENVRWKEIGNV